jgi:VanZ family protein
MTPGRSSMYVHLDRRYALLTIAYVAAVYWLSSLPDLSRPEQRPLVLFLMNVGHGPLFAGLAFCVWKSLSRVGEAGWMRYALTFAVCGMGGALDEWHQSFVRGRMASIDDWLVDLVGIAGTLLLLRVHAQSKERQVQAIEQPLPFGPTGPAAHAASVSSRK